MLNSAVMWLAALALLPPASSVVPPTACTATCIAQHVRALAYIPPLPPHAPYN